MGRPPGKTREHPHFFPVLPFLRSHRTCEWRHLKSVATTMPLLVNLFAVYLLSVCCVTLGPISKSLKERWRKEDERTRTIWRTVKDGI